MDLRNLISKNDDEPSNKSTTSRPLLDIQKTPTQFTSLQQQQQQQQQQTTPLPLASILQETTPSRSNSQPRLSIHDLMNNDSNINNSNNNGNIQPSLMTPLTDSNSNGQPQQQTHKNLEPNEIRKRNSITNLTNDDDIAIDGKKTLNLTRRLSSTNSSELGSPLINNKFVEPKSRKKSVSTIHEQIKELEELNNKKNMINHNSGNENSNGYDNDEQQDPNKPKRYNEKPTWAKDFIPTAKSNKPHSRSTDPLSSISNSFNVPTTKLAIPSITGSIPRNDFNKVITEWIWANVAGLRQDYSDVPNVEDYIELELKVGNIWDKVKDRRLQLPINTEAVLSVDFFHNECYFKSGIPMQKFTEIKGYLNKISQDNNSNSNKQNKFVVENSHLIDLIASEKKRNDRPITGRVSVDVKTKRKMYSIQKQRIADLIIFLPNTLYDLRLSLSLELPYELNDSAFENFKSKVSLEREKERISFNHLSTFTKIDLTKVKENKVAKYELELELNTIELLKSMKFVGDDPLYYIDLIQSFLDNGRIITRQLSIQQY